MESTRNPCQPIANSSARGFRHGYGNNLKQCPEECYNLCGFTFNVRTLNLPGAETSFEGRNSVFVY